MASMTRAHVALVLVLLTGSDARGRGRRSGKRLDDVETDEGLPAHWSTGKRAEVARATKAEGIERERRAKAGLAPLPLFPAHATVCNGRPCRPGEGNLKGYTMWSQPYEHREAYVQSRSRKRPHEPDPTTTYAGLVSVAKRIQKDGLVFVTAGDFDYREMIYNWMMHAHKLKYYNSLVLAMDAELYTDLVRRRIPTFDNSALLDAWNGTCLQRHIQAVRMERHLGIAALVGAGISVFHAEASVVLLRDVMPYLRAQPDDVDLLFQRDDWPAEPVRTMGCAVNTGLYFLRAAKSTEVVRFVTDAAKRGLIEFYLRWNNIVDQYGFSFVLSESGVRPATSEWANTTALGTVKRVRFCALSAFER